MLKTMRKMTKPIMWFVAIIFVAFLGWQGVFTDQQAPNSIAEINGQDISYQVYDSFYQRNYKLAQQQYGDTIEFDDYIVKQIKDKTWEDIVTQSLLYQEAKKRGIVVTDKEVFEYLRRFPPFEILDQRTIEQFMTEGQFDYRKYAQALVDPNVDWSFVEAYVKERLLTAKLQMTVTSLARVSEEEVKNNWLQNNTVLNVRFVRFPAEKYSDQIQTGPEVIEQFYQKNKSGYWREERANLNYVEFPLQPQSQDELQVKKRLEELKTQAKNEADFAGLARQYSEDQATKDNGGDLGWIDEGGFIRAFDAVLKSLSPGEVSEPLRSNYGWHLVRLHEKRITTEGKRQYHVSHILIKPTLSKQSLLELKQKAAEFAGKAKSGDFEKLCQEYQRPIGITGWFNRQAFIQNFGDIQEVRQFAFSAKAKEVSQAIETPNGFYILKLIERRPAGPAGLDEVQAQVVVDYRKGAGLDLALQDAKLLYQELQKGQSLTKVAKSRKLTVGETGLFKANEPLIPKVGRSPEFIERALAFSPQGKPSLPFRSSGSAFVIELISKESVPDSVYAAAKDSLYRETLQAKQSEIYNLWYSQLRSKAEIKDNRDKFFREEETPVQG